MFKLSPSKAHRYLQCTKSLEYDTEFVESPATIRGSLLHKYAEMIIKNEETEGFLKEHNISDYESFLINGYVDSVWREKDLVRADKIIVEEKRSIQLYGFSINLIMDTLILGKDTASVIDLKTGNNNIDAIDNEQLLFYAYAVLQEYPDYEKFRISIFQKGKLKTHEVSQDDVYDFFLEKDGVFEQIKHNKLTYNPSDKACKYCAIKDSCKARATWIIGGK
jgi:CRISPR/Cas system-associated exonuclease Cas4 (RecB family)